MENWISIFPGYETGQVQGLGFGSGLRGMTGPGQGNGASDFKDIWIWLRRLLLVEQRCGKMGGWSKK